MRSDRSTPEMAEASTRQPHRDRWLSFTTRGRIPAKYWICRGNGCSLQLNSIWPESAPSRSGEFTFLFRAIWFASPSEMGFDIWKVAISSGANFCFRSTVAFSGASVREFEFRPVKLDFERGEVDDVHP